MSDHADELNPDDDDDDPAVVVHFSPDAEIQAAMNLGACPATIPIGATAAQCKINLIRWLDATIQRYCHGVDIFSKDANDMKIDGSYVGLRGGGVG